MYARHIFRAVFAIAVALAFSGCEDMEEYERVIGYRGPARQNPFLAAERLLGRLGHPVEKFSSFKQLSRFTGTLIVSADSFLNPGEVDTALNWAGRGNHLIILMAGAEQYRDDWKEPGSSRLISESEEEEENKKQRSDGQKRLAEVLDFDYKAGGEPALATVSVAGRRMEVQMPGRVWLNEKKSSRDVNGDWSLASIKKNAGRVTLLADARPFRNRYISEFQHAELLNALVNLGYHDGVAFLIGSRVSFWRMLWDKGWMIVVCLVLLVVAWVWRHIPRFGPVLALPDAQARDFTEHLSMAGLFLWQHRQGAELLAPLQRDLHSALLRHGFVPDDPATQEQLAARAGMTADRVRQALFLVSVESPSVFLRTVQDIQALRSKI